jgi:hypothetical protein
MTVATQGTATMTAGQAQVENTSVTLASLVMLTRQEGPADNAGSPYVSGRNVGVGFTISSTNDADTATVAWQLL